MPDQDQAAITLRSIREVCDRLGVTRQFIHKEVKLGRFPPPVRLGTRTLRFRECDIAEYVAKNLQSVA